MMKSELVEYVVRYFVEHPIVFTTGYAARLAYGCSPDSTNHFYMVGSMGMASAIARGVVSQAPQGRPVPVVVDGDGALLMGLQTLVLTRETSGGPILHLVANDSSYASTGGQQVPRSSHIVREVASACGYGLIREVRTLSALEASLEAGLRAVAGGEDVLLDCRVESGTPPPARIEIPLPEVAARFSRFCVRWRDASTPRPVNG